MHAETRLRQKRMQMKQHLPEVARERERERERARGRVKTGPTLLYMLEMQLFPFALRWSLPSCLPSSSLSLSLSFSLSLLFFLSLTRQASSK